MDPSVLHFDINSHNYSLFLSVCRNDIFLFLVKLMYPTLYGMMHVHGMNGRNKNVVKSNVTLKFKHVFRENRNHEPPRIVYNRVGLHSHLNLV